MNQTPLQKLLDMPRGRLGVIVGVPLLLILGILIHNYLVFHITNIDPSPDTFPDSSPVIYVDFNHPLRTGNVTVSVSPGVPIDYTINGTRLTIHLHKLLQDGVHYLLSLSGIVSTSNESLAPTTYNLTVTNTPLSQLSSEVQSAITSRQDTVSQRTRNSTIYAGTDTLVNEGLSLFQLDAFKQAIFLYGQSLNTSVTSVIINTDSVEPMLPGPNDPAGQFTMNFQLAINNKPYTAKLIYSDVNVVHLYLYSPSNTQVYDSGTIDDSKLQ